MKIYSRDTQKGKCMPYTLVPCSLGKREWNWMYSDVCWILTVHRIFLGSRKAVTVAVVTAGPLECRLGGGPGTDVGRALSRVVLGKVWSVRLFACEGRNEPGRKQTQSPHSDAVQLPRAVLGPPGHSCPTPLFYESISLFIYFPSHFSPQRKARRVLASEDVRKTLSSYSISKVKRFLNDYFDIWIHRGLDSF